MDRILGYFLSNLLGYLILILYFDSFLLRKDPGKKLYLFLLLFISLNTAGNLFFNP